MNGLEDLNQKILTVAAFMGLLLLAWWYVKTKFSNVAEFVGKSQLKHVESRRLAHAAVLSVFEVNKKTVLILQDKQGASVLDITETEHKGRDHDALS